MKKTIIFALLALICISFVSAAYTSSYYPEQRSGVERITHYDPRVHGYQRKDVTAYLKPIEPKVTQREFKRGYPYYAPRATARILTSVSAYKPTSQVYVKTNDLKPSYIDNAMYEAWLYDTESGNYISLGIFFVNMGGTGALEMRINHYFDHYDYVIVTKEPYPDIDPRPAEQVLIGEIPERKLYPGTANFNQNKAYYGYSLA